MHIDLLICSLGLVIPVTLLTFLVIYGLVRLVMYHLDLIKGLLIFFLFIGRWYTIYEVICIYVYGG